MAANRFYENMGIHSSIADAPYFDVVSQFTESGYAWQEAFVKATGVINQFYFYCMDGDFGPFFIKFCSYFLYNAKLCINGNHWARRQAAKAGIGFTPMDNAFATCADPAALQKICDRLSPTKIDALLRKWLRYCHTHSPAPTGPPDTAMTSPSCSASSP